MHIKNGFFGVLLFGVLISLPAEGIAEEQSRFISHHLQLNEKLPLEKVVLFTSGVGYFEHRGYIEGDTSLQVSFGTQEMPDILKSIVLQDFDGGKVRAVQYQPPEPLQRKLRQFSFDLDSNTSLYDLLRQARGEQVEIQLGEELPLTGRILGVETSPGNETTPPKKQLSLYSDGSITKINFNEMKNLRFSDPVLQEELQEILTILAGARRTEQRSLTFNFTGEGRREVMVGYIREMPVWKTTYRLVRRETQQPLLQGWAIAENSTDFDWEGVELKLVAGRPISFKMDVYSPLYVARPELLPPVHKSARPPLYEEGYSGDTLLKEPPAAVAKRRRSVPEPKGEMAFEMESRADENLGYGGGPEQSFSSGVSAAAAGAEEGEYFAYTIDSPVSLKKRSSALVPIVQQAVEAEAISVYGTQGTASSLAGGQPGNQRTLKSLKMTNTTGLHLMGGPVTLFEKGMYAGDARFDDIVPESSRLISYAEDLETQVIQEHTSLPEQVMDLSIKNGVFSYTQKQRRSVSYRLINRGTDEARLMVQHPKHNGWNLVQPKTAEEETSSFYRFIRNVKSGEEKKILEVVEEYPQKRSIGISNLEHDRISFYLENVQMSAELQSALTRIQNLQLEIDKLQQESNNIQSKIDAIYRTQERIRSNMEQLDRDSRLYTQYVSRLTDQEEELEALQTRTSQLKERISSTRNELNSFMNTLDIES